VSGHIIRVGEHSILLYKRIQTAEEIGQAHLILIEQIQVHAECAPVPVKWLPRNRIMEGEPDSGRRTLIKAAARRVTKFLLNRFDRFFEVSEITGLYNPQGDASFLQCGDRPVNSFTGPGEDDLALKEIPTGLDFF
jgi:hypothetical protein